MFYRLIQSLKDYGAKVSQVACGETHTIFLTADGEVLACGAGESGRLGVGSSENATIPTSLSALIDETVIAVAAGVNHSACLTADGRVLTWGKNDVGQLGHADTYMDVLYSQEELPRVVDGLPKIAQISLARGRTSVVSKEGELYIWGALHHHIPTLIEPSLFNNLRVTKAYSLGGSGGVATLAITEDGSLWAFGEKSTTILGHKYTNTFGKITTPERISFTTSSTTPTTDSNSSTSSSSSSSSSSSTSGGKIGHVLDVYGGLGKHVFAKVETYEESI